MDLSHSVATVTVQVLAGNSQTTKRHSNDVDFEVKYPEGYAGPKIMPEGPVVISKEAAEKFTSMGIGEVVIEDLPENVVDENKPVLVDDNNASSENHSEGSDNIDADKTEFDSLSKSDLQAALTEKGIEFKNSMTKPELINILRGKDVE